MIAVWTHGYTARAGKKPRAERRARVSKERLGLRPDFDEWANSVVSTVKKHRRRFGESPGSVPEQSRFGFRRWASRMLTKIAD
jgi:hypothetical protein